MSPTDAKIESARVEGMLVKYRIPESPGPHPAVFMLHGWTGDEDSMWIFAMKMPQDALLIAPRGLYRSSLGGYGWYLNEDKAWPRFEDFFSAVEALDGLRTSSSFPSVDFSSIRMVGFSQGAALAYTFAMRKKGVLQAIAGLSGFFPDGAEMVIAERPLKALPIFVAHGTRDQIVPIERARQAVALLGQAGAQVSFCEHDVGHKLNAACFRGMQVFFQEN
jgi:phospholipase/carboxylesterase